MKSNLMVAVEGLDASGKATQSKLLAERLNGTRFSFPNYDSPTGRMIREHLKGQWEAQALSGSSLPSQAYLNDLLFQCLQTVNRLESLPVIRKAQAKGPVVFDRYWVSAVVYGMLDGLDREWLMQTQEAPMPPADVWILLDIPVEESFKRRPEGRDRYEADSSYLERVRKGYLELFTGCDNLMWHRNDVSRFRFAETKPEWFVVDGIGTIDEVHERICAVVDRYRG